MDDFARDVAAVRSLDIVPKILETICRLTGMRFAAVARVTEDRWIACEVRDEIDFGLKPGSELRLDTTICSEVRDCLNPVVIGNVDEDPVYATHRTPQMYGFKSYLSIPIVLPTGEFFGTLCAIDPRPAHLRRVEIVDTVRLFADLIAMHLISGDRLAQAEASLFEVRSTAVLREQFIAVVGHDLRNPLAALSSGAHLLDKEPQSAKARRILTLMNASLDRMAQLIENVLDFARGRLGGGISLDRRPVEIERLLSQLVAECQSANPGRAIVTVFAATVPLDCDPVRIGQLVSNLLGNAISHGAVDQPVTVACGVEDAVFRISITNGGREIPAAVRAKIFEPFERNADGNRDGLGLGLYIASQIASAHDGTLAVTSSPTETCFTFAMSVSPD